MMKPFRMALPTTVDAAVQACTGSFADQRLLAGGTDLLGSLKERIETPAALINLKSIPGLDRIDTGPEGLAIGALATLASVAEHPEARSRYPALVDTIGKAATPQLRNVGTLGGNLCQRPRCHYFRDESYRCKKKGGTLCYAQQGENEHHAIFENGLCAIVHPSNCAPVLMAHDATVEIAAPHGTLVRMPIEAFFTRPEQGLGRENVLGPDRVLTRVLLPAASATRHCAYLEAREKQSFDWALCGVTVWLERAGDRVRTARIVLSAVAPRPLRRPDLEARLAGRALDEPLIEDVCNAAVAPATPLAQNAYKRDMLRALLARALRQAWEGKP